MLYPRYTPPPPDADSTRGKALMSDVEKELQNLLVVARLRNKEGWYESSKSSEHPMLRVALHPIGIASSTFTRPPDLRLLVQMTRSEL